MCVTVWVLRYKNKKNGDRGTIVFTATLTRKCLAEGCSKQPSLGVAGTKMAEYCAQHAPDGMVNVRNKRCTTEDCGKEPSF